jgi:hypothetical protein
MEAAIKITNVLFWSVDKVQTFEQTSCIYLHRRVRSTLKMEAECYSETLVPEITWRHAPKTSHVQISTKALNISRTGWWIRRGTTISSFKDSLQNSTTCKLKWWHITGWAVRFPWRWITTLKRSEPFARWHGVMSQNNGLLNPVVVGKMTGYGLGGIRFPKEAWCLLFAVAPRRTLWFAGAQWMEHDATQAVTVCWYAVESGNCSTVPIAVSNVPVQEWNRRGRGSRARRTTDSTGNKIMWRGHSRVKEEMTTTLLRWEEERYENHSKPHERSGEE